MVIMPGTFSINALPTHEQSIIVYDGPRTITTLTTNSGIATFEKVSGDDSLSVTTNGVVQFNGDNVSANKDFLTVIIKAINQEGEETNQKISFAVNHGFILDSANTQFSYSNSTKIITFAPVWTLDNKTPIYATETIVQSDKEIHIGNSIQFEEFPEAEDEEGDTISYIIVDVEDGNGVSLGENIKNTFSISDRSVSYDGSLWNLEPAEIHIVIAAYDNENITNISSEKCRIRLAVNNFVFPTVINLKSTPPFLKWDFVNDFSGLIEYHTAGTTLEYSFDNGSTWSTTSTHKATESFNVDIRLQQDHTVTASKSYTKGITISTNIHVNLVAHNGIGLGTSLDPYSFINYDISTNLVGTLAENVRIEYTTDNEQTWSTSNTYIADTAGAISFKFRYQDTNNVSSPVGIIVYELDTLLGQQPAGNNLIFSQNYNLFPISFISYNNSNIVYSITGQYGPWYNKETEVNIPYGEELTIHYKFENTTTTITRTFGTGLASDDSNAQGQQNDSGGDNNSAENQDPWASKQEINFKDTINISVSDAATWSLNLNTLLEQEEDVDWHFKIGTDHLGLSIFDSFLFLIQPMNAGEQRLAVLVGTNASKLTKYLTIAINIEDQTTEPDVEIFSGVSNITDTTTINLENELNGTYVVYATPIDIYGNALTEETDIELYPHIIKSERPLVNVVYDGNVLDASNRHGHVKVVLTKSVTTDVPVNLVADNGLQLGSNLVTIFSGQTEASTTVTVTSFTHNHRELLIEAVSSDNPYVIIGQDKGIVSVPGDAIPPEITVIGGIAEITQGSTYNDEGATATDNIEGNISDKIIISDNLNINVPGVYYVTYNVSDSIGNAAIEKTRTVKVKPAVSATHILVPENSVNWSYDLSNLLTVDGTSATWKLQKISSGIPTYHTSTDDFVIADNRLNFTQNTEPSFAPISSTSTEILGWSLPSFSTAIEAEAEVLTNTSKYRGYWKHSSGKYYMLVDPPE